MAYKLIVTEHADKLLDNLVHHLLYRIKNEQAARHLLDGIENVYERLEENPLQFPLSDVRSGQKPDLFTRSVFNPLPSSGKFGIS